MPINRLLKDSNLAPEEQQALKQAFDRSLRKLHLVNRNDPVCEIVAQLGPPRKACVANAAGTNETIMRA